VAVKLDKFDSSEDDCTRAIELDEKFIKAWVLTHPPTGLLTHSLTHSLTHLLTLFNRFDVVMSVTSVASTTKLHMIITKHIRSSQ
jgi:hypothetical protein